MMLEHEFEEAMDSQRTLLAKRDQYAEQAERHERRVEIAEALEAERMAGECLFEVLQLAQKVGEAQWEELQATKGELREVKDERDTLAAELVALRAGLPRWTRMDAWPSHWSQTRRPVWRLGYGECSVISVSYEHGNVTQDERQRGDYASARKRAEALLGLPPCDVEGE